MKDIGIRRRFIVESKKKKEEIGSNFSEGPWQNINCRNGVGLCEGGSW